MANARNPSRKGHDSGRDQGGFIVFPIASTSVNSADVLIDLVGALKAQYRIGASWLMNPHNSGNRAETERYGWPSCLD